MDIQTIMRNGFKFSFVNRDEFEAVYKQIFEDDEYPFSSARKDPFIIDCGSHIGITIIYFKSLYPQSQIIAFEPNPITFKLLELNVKQNNISGIELINKAVSDRNGEIELYVERGTKPWGWGDSAAINKWYDSKKFKTIKVGAIELAPFIDREVDLLKMDIEGTEGKILENVEKKLENVKQIMMEFHGSSTNSANNEERILDILKRNKFSYKLKAVGNLARIIREDPYWLLIYATK